MRVLFALAGALALAATAAVPAQAHHSMAMFDSARKVTIEGTVKEFQWTNPHSYIQLMAPENGGAKVVEWSFELGAPMYLYARGWRPKTLKPGDKITVTYYPLRSGQAGGMVVDIVTADGKKLGQKA